MSEKAKAEITREDLDKETYGWEERYNPRYCGQKVFPDRISTQCSRKPKPGSLWCGIHSPEAEAKRTAKRNARYEAYQETVEARTGEHRQRKLAEIATELTAALSAMLRRQDVFSARQSALSALDRYEEIVGKGKP